MKRDHRPRELPDLGTDLQSAIARRDRIAGTYAGEFGAERVFPELIDAVLDELRPEDRVLEVGAATGLMTAPLLERVAAVTALEPSAGLLRRLLDKEIGLSPKLHVLQGLAEDLPEGIAFDAAVVTFTPRRGQSLSRLLGELVRRVSGKIVLMMEESSLDWVYLARDAADQGFEPAIRIISGAEEHKREVLLCIGVRKRRHMPAAKGVSWTPPTREVPVPYPPPRAAAARLMRHFLSSGEPSMLVVTDPRGADRLYGNLRTAAHRLGREEVAVRRHGDAIQVVRLPRGE